MVQSDNLWKEDDKPTYDRRKLILLQADISYLTLDSSSSESENEDD